MGMGGRGGEVTLDKPQVQEQGTGKVGSEPNLPQGGSRVTLVQKVQTQSLLMWTWGSRRRIGEKGGWVMSQVLHWVPTLRDYRCTNIQHLHRCIPISYKERNMS